MIDGFNSVTNTAIYITLPTSIYQCLCIGAYSYIAVLRPFLRSEHERPDHYDDEDKDAEQDWAGQQVADSPR
jgi:hypothetical protein